MHGNNSVESSSVESSSVENSSVENSSAAASSAWTSALPLALLKEKGRRIVDFSDKKIVVFWHDDQVFACDNRCPHEGFPLSEGQVSSASLAVFNGPLVSEKADAEQSDSKQCLITCNWHNWKFNLKDGTNLFGGDELRTYPTRIENGEVWLDLADAPLAVQQDKACARLSLAIEYNDYPLIARELLRASQVGVTSTAALHLAVQWAHQRLAFGTSHSLTCITDWLTLREERTDPAERLTCLVEPLAHMANDTARVSRYPYAEAVEEGTPKQLATAIESENEALAIGILRHLLACNTPLEHLQRTLSHCALAHYGDLGHSLIFVHKTFLAIDTLGESSALPLLLPLVRTLVFATREELLPAFRDYTPSLKLFQAGEAAQAKHTQQPYEGMGTKAALAETVSRRNYAPEQTWLSLYEAICEQVYRFDVSKMQSANTSVSDNVSWPTVTHGIPFAAAIRSTCQKHPELWAAGLIQLSCVVGRNLGSRDLSLPTACVDPLSAREVFEHCLDLVVNHKEVEPIVSTHLLKTTMAARSLWREGCCPPAVLAGLQRYFQIPLVRRYPLRTCRQAIAQVGPFEESP